jgi:hypothetical protein
VLAEEPMRQMVALDLGAPQSFAQVRGESLSLLQRARHVPECLSWLDIVEAIESLVPARPVGVLLSGGQRAEDEESIHHAVFQCLRHEHRQAVTRIDLPHLCVIKVCGGPDAAGLVEIHFASMD